MSFCPLIKSDCVKAKCAWWDHGNQCCAVLAMVCERIRATEAVIDNAPRPGPQVKAEPIVQIKEVIQEVVKPIEIPSTFKPKNEPIIGAVQW